MLATKINIEMRTFFSAAGFTKRAYLAPIMHVMYITLEEGIATSSARVSGGMDSKNPHTPGIEGWGDEPVVLEAHEELY